MLNPGRIRFMLFWSAQRTKRNHRPDIDATISNFSGRDFSQTLMRPKNPQARLGGNSKCVCVCNNLCPGLCKSWLAGSVNPGWLTCSRTTTNYNKEKTFPSSSGKVDQSCLAKSCETVKHRCDSSYVTKGKTCIWHTKVSTLPSLPMFHF